MLTVPSNLFSLTQTTLRRLQVTLRNCELKVCKGVKIFTSIPNRKINFFMIINLKMGSDSPSLNYFVSVIFSNVHVHSRLWSYSRPETSKNVSLLSCYPKLPAKNISRLKIYNCTFYKACSNYSTTALRAWMKPIKLPWFFWKIITFHY